MKILDYFLKKYRILKKEKIDNFPGLQTNCIKPMIQETSFLNAKCQRVQNSSGGIKILFYYVNLIV